jgi:hypothetical protein
MHCSLILDKIYPLFILIFIFLQSFIYHSALAQEPKRIAILELNVYQTDVLKIEELLLLTDEIRQNANQILGDRFFMMTRENMNALVESPDVLAKCIGECEVQIGRLLQADYILSGNLIKLDGGEMKAILKLHQVKEGRLLGVQDAVGSDLKTLSLQLKDASSILILDLIKTKQKGNATPLEKLVAIKAIEDLKLPLPLLKKYDEALKNDEDPKITIESKISTWLALTHHQEYPKLIEQASKRSEMWQNRYQRKLECQASWEEIAVALKMTKVLSDADKSKAVLSYVDQCGTDEQINPQINHFEVRRILAEEEERKRRIAIEERIEKEKQLAFAQERETAIKQFTDQMSFLEVSSGFGAWRSGVYTFGIKFRLQPNYDDFNEKKRFYFDFDLFTTPKFIRPNLLSGEINPKLEISSDYAYYSYAFALGYQFTGTNRLIPSFGLGFSGNMDGLKFPNFQDRLFAEAQLRYLVSPEFFGVGIGVKGFGNQEYQVISSVMLTAKTIGYALLATLIVMGIILKA